MFNLDEETHLVTPSTFLICDLHGSGYLVQPRFCSEYLMET